MSVILETTIGDLVIDLFTDERPRACLNFLKLCKIKFYNYSLFHVVQANFLAQTGDPTGSGRGGESIFRHLYGDQATFFEAETKPRIKHIKKGTVSMVNNGNDMHGSQFFITLGENLDYLDGQHTVFGEVAEGFEILDKLNEIICDDNHRPYQDVRITHTVILDDPYDDPAGLKVPDRSPEPTKEQLDSGRIGADEEIDDTKGKTMEEVEEMIEEREFKAGTQILEMVGDIPDAEIKPPDNVLFVCKLNPVTTDEDLEIIFSRFGPVKCCEIIKDSVSKESLQYAFVEYENAEDCERAYFKMDNVLIDDRRIHVDFSQSVSKLAYNKPGSKPVYELKEKKESKPKLKIKDSSKKDKYDLVFGHGDSGSEDEKKVSSKKHKKDHYRKRQRTSSEERSPDNTRHRASEMRSGGNRHGNHSSVDSVEPRDRKAEQNKRDRKRGEDNELRDKEGRSAEKVRRGRHSDDSDDGNYGNKRDKKGHPGKHEDKDGNRGSEGRYSRKNRDKTRDRGKHELEDCHRDKERKGNRGSEDTYSRDNRDQSRDQRDHSRDKRDHRDKKGHRGNEEYSRDNRGDDRRKEKSRNMRDRGSSSRDDSGSEDEHRGRKRGKDENEKQDRRKKKKNRHDSSESSS